MRAALLAFLVLVPLASAAVGNSAQHVTVASDGLAAATCQWAVLVNTLAATTAPDDSLSLVPLKNAAAPRSGGAASGSARCDVQVRNLTVTTTLAPGFAQPSRSGAFAPAAGSVPVGNGAVVLASDAYGSSWSTCQWLVAVNTVVVLPGVGGANVPPLGAAPRLPANATAESSCSVKVDGFRLDVVG